MKERCLIAVAAMNSRGLDSEVSQHFGHSPYFVFLESEGGRILSGRVVANPYIDQHKPGEIPRFIREHGATVLISGAMGYQAIDLFAEFGIKVHTGADGTVREAVAAWQNNSLPDSSPCGQVSD